MRKWKLHQWIVVGMGVGLASGLLMFFKGDAGSVAFQRALWWLNLLGKDLFVGGLKMIIAPLIFASIVAGITSLPNSRELGAIGWKTFAYYFATTAMAVLIGLAAVLLIRPGHKSASQRVRMERAAVIDSYREAYRARINGADPLDAGHIEAYRHFIADQEGGAREADFTAKWDRITSTRDMTAGAMFRRDILQPILTNPFLSLTQTNSLGIIFFAVLVGLACMIVGAPARPVVDLFQAFNKVMMTITLWVMNVAPVAIGCLIASVVATLGLDALRSLGWYCAAVIVGIGLHVCFLLLVVGTIGRMSPLKFLAGIRDAWLIAFSTTSSAATLPVTLKNVTGNLGVSDKVANFGLPVGATINMDGTALYEGVAVIFMIQLYGGLDDVPIILTAMKTFIIFITAVVASVGAAAVPSAGLITMAIVASAVGLPLHYIFFIYAVDHVLDMFRTSTNVMGDAVGAVVVNRLERDRLGEG
ncbi:MAG: dicarboxylate/amino acid:cation symporter [Verrucomicrobia bacterium]|nr:dicarboxylate/amino acid:cation symporter [Verrucomicrobiota bacterium]